MMQTNNSNNYLNTEKVRFFSGDLRFDLEGGLQVKTLVITPDMAKKMKGFSAGNRAIKPAHVKAISKTIKEWGKGVAVIGGQPISFNKDGVQMDGHHRIEAIILADKPAQIMVSFNVPDDVMLYTDRNITRSISDCLSLYGRKELGFAVSRRKVSIANAIVVNFIALDQKVNLKDPLFVEDVLFKYKDAIKFVDENIGSVKLISTASNMAALVAAYDFISPQKMKDFCEVLRVGSTSPIAKTTSNAPLVFRDWVLQGKHIQVGAENGMNVTDGGTAQSSLGKMVAYVLQYCLQKFIEGKDIQRISVKEWKKESPSFIYELKS